MASKLGLFVKGLKQGMKDFGENIAAIINSAALSISYFIGVGITAIIAKIVGKKFLDKKIDNRASYWEDLNLEKEDKEKYYRMF